MVLLGIQGLLLIDLACILTELIEVKYLVHLSILHLESSGIVISCEKCRLMEGLQSEEEN